MATWTPGAPVLGDTISQSFSNIRDNWAVLANAWNGDHQTLTSDGTSSDQHLKVTMPVNVGAIGATPGIGKLYTKDVGGGVVELVYEDEAANEIQITGNAIATANGEIDLPGGIGIKWGTVSLGVLGTTAVTYTGIGLTAFSTDTFVLTLGGQTTNTSYIIAKSSTGFTLNNPSVAQDVDWIAIGI
jgi:hypothetical protein